MSQPAEAGELVSLVGDLAQEQNLTLKPDRDTPSLYTAVISSARLTKVADWMETRLGKPYKARGEWALWKNWFDPFVKGIGGIHRDQLLYRKDLQVGGILYCAFWPWASDPKKTTVRMGLFRPGS